jgi:hypothetical protein
MFTTLSGLRVAEELIKAVSSNNGKPVTGMLAYQSDTTTSVLQKWRQRKVK